MNSKAEILIELGGALLVSVCMTYAAVFSRGEASLFWFFLTGAIAGAVLGAIGGKKFQLLELGMQSAVTKIAAHLCVVAWTGPAVLEWSLKKFEGQADPEAIASAAGGVVALFGTSLLIMVVPVIAAWVRYFLWKRIPMPPATPAANPENSTQGQ